MCVAYLMRYTETQTMQHTVLVLRTSAANKSIKKVSLMEKNLKILQKVFGMKILVNYKSKLFHFLLSSLIVKI